MPLDEKIEKMLKTKFSIALKAVEQIESYGNDFYQEEVYHASFLLAKRIGEIFDYCSKQPGVKTETRYKDIPWEAFSQLRHGLVHAHFAVTPQDLNNFFGTHLVSLKTCIGDIAAGHLSISLPNDITQSFLFQNTRNYTVTARLRITATYTQDIVKTIENFKLFLDKGLNPIRGRAVENNIEILGEICDVLTLRVGTEPEAKLLFDKLIALGLNPAEFKLLRNDSAHNTNMGGTMSHLEMTRLWKRINGDKLLEGDVEKNIMGLKHFSAWINKDPSAQKMEQDFLSQRKAFEEKGGGTQIKTTSDEKESKKDTHKKESNDVYSHIARLKERSQKMADQQAKKKTPRKNDNEKDQKQDTVVGTGKEEKKDDDKEEKKQPVKRKADTDTDELDKKNPQKQKLNDEELAVRAQAEAYGATLSSQGDTPSSSSSMSALANPVSVKPPSSAEAMTSTARAHSSSSSSSSSSTHKTESDPTPPSSNKPPSL